MATSSDVNKSVAARASAVLTTGEVAASAFLLNKAKGGELCLEVLFTLGMLTSVDINHYVSMDGITYYPIQTVGAGAITHNYTADQNIVIRISAPGYRWYRASAKGNGTVTDSLLELNYRYLDADLV